MPSTLVDRLRAGIEELNRSGETPGEFLAPEFELHQAFSIVVTAGVFRGAGAIRGSLGELGESFEDLTFEPERFVEEPGDALEAVGLER